MTYNIPTNVTGIDGIIRIVSENISFFGDGILLIVFLTIAISGHKLSSFTQQSDIFSWLAISAFITTIFSFFLYIINFVGLYTTTICIAFFIIFVLISMFRGGDE